MGKLTFPIDDRFKSIVQHALDAPEQRRGAFCAPLDGPTITLVKDNGAYIMSAGNPAQIKPDLSGCLVHYANEANYETMDRCEAWEAGQAICGGDDFVEYLPAASFQNAIDQGAKTFEITLTEDEIVMEAFR